MDLHYTSEKNSLILISLLKAHGIRNIIASLGTTNLRLVASLQHDSYFKIYSSVDERSAAYMACGLAAESGEPVMLSCTGATSSRNYMPALTEAYYRKLPILVVTSSQYSEWIGNLKDQITNRIQLPADIVKKSFQVDEINCERKEWYAVNKINEAILELTRRGGGPAHINLITSYSPDFSITELPCTRVIHRYNYKNELPSLPQGPIGIFIGSHKKFNQQEEANIEAFCKKHHAIVFCDHTSGYYGKYKMNYSLIQLQSGKIKRSLKLLIHLGEISGDMFNISPYAQEVWRVSEDGEIRDPFKKLVNVFEMDETFFFNHYAKEDSTYPIDEYPSYKEEYEAIMQSLPDLPFSNIWMASVTSGKLPEGTILHLGILTSLRSWNFFKLPQGVISFSNVGGFGIDGNMSTLIGASWVHPEKLYLGVVGDLSFFYDMNSLGNRHLGKNIRILLVNNGKGCEFTHHMNMGSMLGHEAYPYICAEGHYGKQSPKLIRHYAEDLGFIYLTASGKEEYEKVLPDFLNPSSEKPILLEAFTKDTDENTALKIMSTIRQSRKEQSKEAVKRLIGEETYGKLKKIFKG
ncbi:thiamine pyrophosphate-binding protein [Paraprevotella clara]|mgnify:FL=1|jgi:hypothetical protein|uniref:thiamine pyrophosphate-binding protein n=1 Tax=Paraprevotella clara TaxID=454154 RepID=UPI00307BB483